MECNVERNKEKMQCRTKQRKKKKKWEQEEQSYQKKNNRTKGKKTNAQWQQRWNPLFLPPFPHLFFLSFFFFLSFPSRWTFYGNWDITLEHKIRQPSNRYCVGPLVSHVRNIGMEVETKRKIRYIIMNQQWRKKNRNERKFHKREK